MSDEVVEQAGAIVVRRAGDTLDVLLVRSTRPPHPWLFPKGHIEDGESSEEAAERELLEEAGVTGSLVGRVGDTEFVKRSQRYHVVYYLFEPLTTGIPHEPRPQKWFSDPEAFDHLEYDELKRLLVKALTLVRARG